MRNKREVMIAKIKGKTYIAIPSLEDKLDRIEKAIKKHERKMAKHQEEVAKWWEICREYAEHHNGWKWNSAW